MADTESKLVLTNEEVAEVKKRLGNRNQSNQERASNIAIDNAYPVQTRQREGGEAASKHATALAAANAEIDRLKAEASKHAAELAAAKSETDRANKELALIRSDGLKFAVSTLRKEIQKEPNPPSANGMWDRVSSSNSSELGKTIIHAGMLLRSQKNFKDAFRQRAVVILRRGMQSAKKLDIDYRSILQPEDEGPVGLSSVQELRINALFDAIDSKIDARSEASRKRPIGSVTSPDCSAASNASDDDKDDKGDKGDGSTDASLRSKYESAKERHAKLQKVCHAIGVSNVVDKVLEAGAEHEASILKSTKSAMALIHRHGGPDKCAQELNSMVELRKEKYAMALILAGVKPRDVIMARIPETDVYTILVVSPTPDPEFPTCATASTAYVNDGPTATNSTIQVLLGSGPGMIEHCINNQQIEKNLDTVFAHANITKLHDMALKNQFTSMDKAGYKNALWKHVKKAIKDKFQEKLNFLNLYERNRLSNPPTAAASAAASSSSSSSSVSVTLE